MNEVKYAGFWIRFIASFLDTLFLALPVGIIIYFVSDGNWFDFAQYQQNLQMAMSGNTHALDSQPQTSLQWELLFEFCVLVVTILFWKKWKGATPGKKFVHIKIVDAKNFQEIRLDYDVTILPPKKEFFPPAQNLVKFKAGGYEGCINPKEKFFLVFIHMTSKELT